MPVPDQRTGYATIWIISCVLFLSIAFGGGCLLMYMILPESKSTFWLPIVGITLVCLPWFFWFITCFYRIISRLCGFRMAIGFGGGGGGGGGGSVLGVGSHANGYSSRRGDGASNNGHVTLESSSLRNNNTRQVQVEANVSNNSQHGRKEACSSSSNSVASHESEMPLTLPSPS